MKKTIKYICILIAFIVIAVPAAGQFNKARVYINPGHGGWGANDRPMATINYAVYDTLGFFETNTNLWKGLSMRDELVAAGAGYVRMSRTRNGIKQGTATNPNGIPEINERAGQLATLSVIAADVEQNNMDYFISIHSNATTEGSTTNFTILLYRGTDTAVGNGLKDSKKMALDAWKHIVNNQVTYYSHYTGSTQTNVRGDITFMNGQSTVNGYTGYYGVLKHGCDGYLSEGCFHTYQPERHRLLNPDYCRQEGVRYARAVRAWFGDTSETKGSIMGTVKDKNAALSHNLYTYKTGSVDAYKPLNNATVTLKNSSGNVVGTYKTDHNHNGVFVFHKLTPGTYTVTSTVSGYWTETASITVKKNETAFINQRLTDTGRPNPNGPSVMPSTGSVAFGNVNIGSTSNKTFTVTGHDLTGNISISSNSSAFTVSPTSLTKNGGTVTVSFKPTAGQNYSGTITLSSSGVSSATVAVTGKGVVPPLALTEGFNIGQTKGNATSKNWDATKVRNFAYGAGKLYMVYNHADIKVVKSQSGDFLYDLNKTGVSGGVLTLCDVGYFDGKAVACNIGNNDTPLKIYVWDTDTSASRVLLNTTNIGGAARLGDVMEFTGNWNSGKITFANDDGTTTRVVSYTISNGTVNATPVVVNATKDGKRLGCAASIRVQPDGSGYWINGKDNAVTRLNTSGVYQYEIPQSNKHGNGFSAFEYKGVQHAVVTTFNGPANYVGGSMQLLDASNGWASSTVLATYPSAGLGTTPNTGCTGGCYAHAGSDYVEAWVLSTGQGIAYYKAGTPPTHDSGSDNNPTIEVSHTSLSISSAVDQSKTASFTVTGQNITGNINVSSNVGQLTVSPSSLGAAGGVVTVTFKPSEVKTYTGTITLSSSGASNKTVAVTATATALGGITFTEGWNQSETKGNANSNAWDASHASIRNMAYGDNGKLYLVYDGNIIKVVESQTGKFVGNMDGTGITGGWPALSDVHYFDGKVIACNLRTAVSHSLKVYVWDGERSKPRVLLETTNVGGLTRIGDNMGLKGDWMDGEISFATTEGGATTLVRYKITNGQVNATPTTLTVTDGGSPLLYTSTVRTIPAASGYYINGKGQNLSYLNASGARQYSLAQTNRLANGATVFSYYGTNYALASTFLEGNYKKGAMQLYNVGTDWSKASLVGTYPAAGLGTTDNSAGLGHAIAATSDNAIELWVLSTNQGIAYYKYGTPPNFGSITLQTSEEMVSDNTSYSRIYATNHTLHIENMDVAKVDMYSLSGVRVLSAEKENNINLPMLNEGVYIVVVVANDGIIRREKIMLK